MKKTVNEMDFKEEIKRNVNMFDILQRYGYKANKNGFVCCPFHNEKTPSFKIFADNQRYKCFGCGEGGDIFSFTMKIFNINFQQAILKLNYDFSLLLPIGKTLTIRERTEILEKQRRIKKKQEQKEKLRATYKIILNELTDAHRRYYNYFLKYKPDISFNISSTYQKALNELPTIEHYIDFIERRLQKI